MSIIIRAALGGAAAGLLAAIFFLTVSQPTIDEAIGFEDQLVSTRADEPSSGEASEVDDPAVDLIGEPEADVEISRGTQTVGGVMAMLMYGFLSGIVFEDWMYERVTAAYVGDKQTRDFFEASNPWALRSIAERLLEADQRGMWNASDDARETLSRAILEAEGWEETR